MTNDNKKAVALKYEKEQGVGVPRIIAVGKGGIADKIIEIAKKEKVPLVVDTEVVEKLVQLPVGVDIPLELYEAVAGILVFIYKLDREARA
ncbi:MAG: EscU/YscU/HrcU family type III secretion system export apparatus switch protein [Clostridia bacterium]|nr:EscU/YscU/HrcU family type III secretion system export apparatus switch protein [Clostridia bacterium]MDD4049126.1 EscU/YscU/HrcU family type III secretion system export apparatus switch protein [Clostridia bacterium]